MDRLINRVGGMDRMINRVDGMDRLINRVDEWMNGWRDGWEKGKIIWYASRGWLCLLDVRTERGKGDEQNMVRHIPSAGPNAVQSTSITP